MRLVSSICAAAIVAVAIAATPDASAQRNRNNQASTVVVVDYQRLLAESAMGRDMAAKLNQVRTQIGGEAQALGPEAQSIEAERQRLAQATRNMSPEQIRGSSTYAPQFDALAQRLQQYQARGQALEGDLQCTQLIALRDFDRAISPIIRSVMEQRGAGVVLDARNVQLTLPAFDITTAVIQQMDQSEATRTSNVARRPVAECQGIAEAAAQ